MNTFIKSAFGRGIACYLIAAQALIGWPLITLGILIATSAQADTETSEPDFSGEQRIGTITYPAEVVPAQGQDEGIIDTKPVLPENSSDLNIRSARIFVEPLVPMSGDPIEGENDALALALNAYIARTDKDDVSALDGFFSQYPQSRWKVALQTNLGILRKKSGYFTDAIQRFQEAWDLGKNEETIEGKAIASRAVGELADINARFGRFSRMKEIFEETDSQNIAGSAQTQLTEAKEGYWLMTRKPAEGFRCGPYAVNAVLNAGKEYVANPRIAKEPSTQQGTNLKQLRELAADVNLSYVPARKGNNAKWVVPMVIHWKVGHFAAITKKVKDRYLVKDPTFGSEIWVTAKALDQEATGYGLIAKTNGKLPTGWTAVPDSEAANVWGKGGAGRRSNPPSANTTQCTGMTVYAIEKMRGTLQLSDIPVGYRPSFGPQIQTLVRYADLTTGQPQNFPFANFGPFWMWNWGTYIEVDAGGSVTVRSGLGGSEVYDFSGYDAVLNQFKRSIYTGAVLRKKAENLYQREMPDGSRETFSQVDGTTGRILLKEMIDPYGNKVVLNYDANMRLTSIVDALGQASAITYKSNTVGNAGFYKVYRVTDPFSRYAEFTYDTAVSRLTKIRDVIGIESSFTYGDDGFVTKLTTPYGDTQFSKYVAPDEAGTGSAQGLYVALPDGSKEALESYIGHEKTTYYWNRKAMALAPGDKSKAEQTNWLLSVEGQVMTDVPEWTKKALEGRVDYSYPNETTTASPDPEDPEGTTHSHIGSLRYPSTVERTVNGQLQKYQYQYNNLGKVTKTISPEPFKRTFEFLYSVNNVDLYEVRQTRSGANDLLAKFTYNSVHQPLTYTNASGRKTTYTYNTRGQILTQTNPKGEVTSYTYNTNGFLTQIDGPLSGTNDRVEMTYDTYGRLQTVKSIQGPSAADQYTLTYSYDALDRVTQVLYPDATTSQIVYSRLDPLRSKDRLNRWTNYTYDSRRQLIAERDPAGRSTLYEWCRCGALQGLTDAMGRVTKWAYDIDGRMTQKTYPDASQEVYTYEADIARLATMVDPGGNTTHYSYNLDNTQSAIAYDPAVGVADVPDVTLSWDSNYNRLASIADSNSTYTYSYVPYAANFFGAPQNGAGRLSAIGNSALSATVSYAYDELGRVSTRQIDGSANEASWAYDAAGRVTSWSNALGTFTPSYVNSSYGVDRLSGVAFPNGQQVNYQWENNTGDFRLKQIQNLGSGSTALSAFDYVTDAANRIQQWTQQRGSSAQERYDFTYDNVDQLVGAVLKNTGTGSILKSYGYNYDPAGNRTSEQVDSNVMGATFNNLNQLTSSSAGGPTRFKGSLNEPGKEVTVGGQPAQLLNRTNFVATVNLTTGTNNVAVVAKDTGNNTRTNNYQVVVPSGATKTLTYDGNGNLLTDGTNTYNWDAKNRMVKISYPGGSSSEFTYDLFDRRSKIVEKDGSSTVTSTKQFVWDGLQVAEERNASNVVQKQYFADGWRDLNGATSYYYTKDHLGSIREVTDGSSSQVAQYSYDPYGRVTKLSGSIDAEMLYTGHYYHALSGLFLAPYRSYDASLGRWISRDPVGENGGVNLYGYVGNSPLRWIDPLGLIWQPSGFGPDPNSNTVVTDGKGGLKVHLDERMTPANTPQEILDAIIEHENSHIEDILKQCPNISSARPAGETIKNEDNVEHAQSEVKASQREIDHLKKVNPTTPEIQDRIKRVEAYRDAFQRTLDISAPR